MTRAEPARSSGVMYVYGNCGTLFLASGLNRPAVSIPRRQYVPSGSITRNQPHESGRHLRVVLRTEPQCPRRPARHHQHVETSSTGTLWSAVEAYRF
ncbi:hypothetical protein [Streptomyces sp. NPDC088775]|uniref:hypothetical protein n=1 Tax=Streptomyces sp. NPDC088775 TaxID=3365896 RepID=UPI003826C7BB